MPRLRSVRQGCCGPCKGPCFDNVLEGRDVSVKEGVGARYRQLTILWLYFATGLCETLQVCFFLLSIGVLHA
jgi:hypothetical protein